MANGGVVSNYPFKIKALASFLSWAIVVFGGAATSFAAEITAVRFGVTSPTETRIVLDSNGLLSYSLDADEAGQGQLLISLSDVGFGEGFAISGRGRGHAAGYAASVTGAKAAIIAVELNKSAKIAQILPLAPSSANARHRLVIDLVSAPVSDLASSLPAREFNSISDVIASVSPPVGPQSAAAAPAMIEPPTPKPAPEISARPVKKPVIVVDAGHGGSDPGAAGPSGSKESALTLEAALALAKQLRESGLYEVVLTRSTDIRLAHEERSRIAREAKADLFISLHADAIADRKVRGGSVYTLSDEGTERSAREARESGDYIVIDQEVGAANPALGGILYKIAQRETSNESDKFAEILIEKLAGVTPLLNNTHRRGNFKVLLAPDVPAVLLELAFISSPRDETNLNSPAWRERTMAAAAGAIDAYFQQKGGVRHANNSVGGSPR